MNLNKAILFLLFVCGSTISIAQTSNLRKAKSSIAKFEEFKSVGTPELGKDNLTEAKEAIDKAVEHNRTKDLAETWTYVALIEANIAVLEDQDEAAQKAVKAIERAQELDEDGKNADNIEVANQTLGQYSFTKGVGAWEEQDFESAYTAFDNALKHLPGDTTLTYYSGLAAIQNQDYDNAIKKYIELLPIKEFSEHKTVTTDISKLYLSKGDTASAIEYADKAAKAYPEDTEAAIQNIELNLIVGNEAKVIEDIERQVAQDPTNKHLYYYLGIAQSASGDSESALASYTKAIDIDPNYLEANTNAAVTVMNSVRDDLNALNADKSLSNNEYNDKVEEIKNNVKVALPYLLKVVELDNENTDALRNLKSYYDFMQDEENATAVQEKIDAMQN